MKTQSPLYYAIGFNLNEITEGDELAVGGYFADKAQYIKAAAIRRAAEL